MGHKGPQALAQGPRQSLGLFLASKEVTTHFNNFPYKESMICGSVKFPTTLLG